MLRITVSESKDAVTFILEGKLRLAWLSELRKAIESATESKRVILDLAALSEIVACSGRGCKDGEETKILAILGFGDVTVGGVVNSSNVAPLPPTLSLFATGLVMLGWFGWRRKRDNAAFTAAA